MVWDSNERIGNAEVNLEVACTKRPTASDMLCAVHDKADKTNEILRMVLEHIMAETDSNKANSEPPKCMIDEIQKIDAKLLDVLSKAKVIAEILGAN